MSMPNIPDINPTIKLETEDSIKLLLNSIALQELGLSHIINAEGEKLQAIIKRFENSTLECEKCKNHNKCDYRCKKIVEPEMLLKFNESIRSTIKTVYRSQTMLQLKMEDICEIKKMINEEHEYCDKNYANSLMREFEVDTIMKKENIISKRDMIKDEIWEKENFFNEVEEVSCGPIDEDREYLGKWN